MGTHLRVLWESYLMKTKESLCHFALDESSLSIRMVKNPAAGVVMWIPFNSFMPGAYSWSESFLLFAVIRCNIESKALHKQQRFRQITMKRQPDDNKLYINNP